MACKDESDIEIFETDFAGRRIDLRCFAYDFFVYSADTFGISGICKWQDTANDYVRSDLIFVISRLVFRHQIDLRFKWNEIFESYYDKDKLESFNGVSDLWVTAVICTIMGYTIRDFFIEAEMLLALTNELIQFLSSKNCELYVADLAKLWCDWIIAEKRTFEKDEGIDAMYKHGLKPYYQCLGDFNAKYIKKYCVPYENSARDVTLKNSMNQLLDEYKKTWGPGTEKCENKMNDPSQEKKIPIYECETTDVATLRRDETSGNRVYECAAYETIPRRGYLRLIRTTAISNAIQFQNPFRDPATRRARSSDSHRRRNTKCSSYTTNEQALNPMSLSSSIAKFFQKLVPKDKETKESPDKQKSLQPEGTFTSALYHTIHDEYEAKIERNRRISDEQKIRNTEGGSCPIGEQAVDPQASSSEQKEQSRRNISSPSVERGSEMVTFEASQSSVSETYDATQCQPSTGAISKKPSGGRRASSARQKRQRRKPSSVQTVGQAFQQMSIDSSEEKQSSEKKPTTPRP